MTRNDSSTRFYSDKHEKSVCKALGARQTSNSGAGKFDKGDVIQEEASLFIECKTAITDKKSLSIQKDWFSKIKEESFRTRSTNTALCFNFGPSSENYYIISEKLMQFLVENLIKENNENY